MVRENAEWFLILALDRAAEVAFELALVGFQGPRAMSRLSLAFLVPKESCLSE